MDECHANIIKAILANPEVIDGLYFKHLWFTNEANVGKIVAVKFKLYRVTATYWKNGSSQEDGDDVTMTLYEFLVDYMFITDDLCITEIDE